MRTNSGAVALSAPGHLICHAATLPRRPVKSGDADGKTKLYFEEIMDYTGPGFPAYTPKGASPRVFWMAPYKSDQMWEPKLYIRPTKTVKAAVIDVDLSASQDIGFLSLLMMNS